MINLISNLFIPLIVLVVIIYGFFKKINIYDSFVNGCKDGLSLSLSIIPYITAMIFGINILIDSSFLTNFFNLFKPMLDLLHIPVDIIPLALTRPISGNASFIVMQNIIIKHGVDSYLGSLASVMQGSTDTTIYVLSLYFGSIGIKNIRYALKAGLLVDMLTVILSIIVISIIF